jgi:hypothetical protein
MKYNLQGQFMEACDCEVICSCWAGVAPDMGQCTGMFAFQIQNGKIDGVDVSGQSVVVISTGPSCDDISRAMVFIDQNASEAQKIKLKQVFSKTSSGPIKALFNALPEVKKITEATISISAKNVSAGSNSVTIMALVGSGGQNSITLNNSPLAKKLGNTTGLTVSSAELDFREPDFDLNLASKSAVSGPFSFTL